jgi:hypothetical protein
MPQFPGGDYARIAFLKENIKLPDNWPPDSITGKVFLTFLVDEKGNIKYPCIMRGLNPILDSIAIATIRKMPKWIPAKQRGVPVRVQFDLAIKFGQGHEYKFLNVIEQEIINDLSSTFKEEDSSIIISPFVVLPIYNSNQNIHELTKKYGFIKRQLKNFSKDTLLLGKNNYFKIINPDSLIKYQNIPHDTAMLIRDPVMSAVEKHYGKSSICHFNKIVFSRDRDYALVGYGIYCGFLCGNGKTVIMKKINNKWILLDTLITWIS